MYINGRKITLEELEQLTDNLISGLILDLYDNIMTDGVDLSIPGTPYKQRQILRKMEKHFVGMEEYEKCAVIRDLIKQKFNLNSNN
jgi:hypothetical protein